MNLHKRQHSIVKYALVLLGLLALTGVQAKEKITFYEYDALGNIVAATDEQGEILWKEHYDPYGNRLVRDRASGDHRIWYTGHQETDFGLIYMGARHYDPTTGRFRQIDPMGFQPNNPQSFNRYAYANNNPYSFIDPDGREAVYGTFYLQSAYHEAHTKAVNLWGSYFVKTSVIVCSSAVAPEAAVATKLSPYMARLLGLRALNRGREVVTKGAEARAKEIHSVLDPRAQRARTTAVTETQEGVRVVSSSERRLTPAQRAQLSANETEGVGVGHAEVTGVNAARDAGLTPTGTAASRPICPTCAGTLSEQGINPLSPLK